jgi:hypothetical protein
MKPRNRVGELVGLRSDTGQLSKGRTVQRARALAGPHGTSTEPLLVGTAQFAPDGELP